MMVSLLPLPVRDGPWISLDIPCILGQLFSFVFLCARLPFTSASSECGDFYDLEKGQTGHIYSVDYPEPYPLFQKCIWLFRSAPGHKIQLTFTYRGERFDGHCSDYLEFRDADKNGDIINTYCDSHSSETVTALSPTLRMKFFSDGIHGNATPWFAEFKNIPANLSEEEDPREPMGVCRSYEFTCRNHECLSMSYRCDGYNDCGCYKGCDEDGCGGLNISKHVQVIISVSVGTGIFVLVCVIAYLVEGKNSYAGSQEEAIREKETRDEQRRRRASRAFSKFISGGDNQTLFKGSPSVMNISNNYNYNNNFYPRRVRR